MRAHAHAPAGARTPLAPGRVRRLFRSLVVAVRHAIDVQQMRARREGSPRGGEASRPSRGRAGDGKKRRPIRIDGARRCLRAARVRHARGARARGLHLAHAGAPLGHAALHLRRRRRGALHRDERRGRVPLQERVPMFVRGGRQRLAPRGHGELHALAAHGDRGLQRGRVAGGHGGCGERATGSLGSARVRGVAMASRIAEMAHSARNEVGGGIGGEDGRRTRAFARGERHDAGGDMRSRLVGGVHAAWDSHRAGRGVPRADRSARQFTLFAWKIFWIRRNPDVRGELPKPEARPRVR